MNAGLPMPPQRGAAFDPFGGAGASLTMSSREIADLVEARHNDVVETIERQFAKGFYGKVVKLPGPIHRREAGVRPRSTT